MAVARKRAPFRWITCFLPCVRPKTRGIFEFGVSSISSILPIMGTWTMLTLRLVCLHCRFPLSISMPRSFSRCVMLIGMAGLITMISGVTWMTRSWSFIAYFRPLMWSTMAAFSLKSFGMHLSGLVGILLPPSKFDTTHLPHCVLCLVNFNYCMPKFLHCPSIIC